MEQGKNFAMGLVPLAQVALHELGLVHLMVAVGEVQAAKRQAAHRALV